MEVVDNRLPMLVPFTEIEPNGTFTYGFRGNVAMKLAKPTKVETQYDDPSLSDTEGFVAEAFVIAGPDIGKFIRFSRNYAAVYRPVDCELVIK